MLKGAFYFILFGSLRRIKVAEIIMFPPDVQEARAQLVTDHLDFVVQIARRMASGFPHSIELSDLIQDGTLGLISAAQRYDPSRGIGFKAFAERRVKGAIIDSLRRDAWPRGVRQQRRRLTEIREEFAQATGELPSDAEVAGKFGKSVEVLRQTQVRINTVEALNPYGTLYVQPGDLPAGMAPIPEISADKRFESGENAQIVRAAIASIPNPRLRQVLRLYYWHGMTMLEMTQELAVNESRVSQLHAAALEKLRAALLSGAWKKRLKVAKPSEMRLIVPKSKPLPRRRKNYHRPRIQAQAD